MGKGCRDEVVRGGGWSWNSGGGGGGKGWVGLKVAINEGGGAGE